MTEYTLQKHPDVADTKLTLKLRNRSKRVKTKIKLIDSCIDLQKKRRKKTNMLHRYRKTYMICKHKT